ncbi:MAG: PKD domain containing protein, partial [Alistipes sp.]|nr:PKD domain containing protein [Alistipes sp.]
DGEGCDLIVKGNMHEGSSEAGIVWLSQDTNGNGLPDDEWYELRGSEWDAPTTWRDYAVTYYAPAADEMDILWRDNRGEQGRIARVDAHLQPSYYPAWADKESLTLYGTRLESRTTQDAVTGNYVNAPFAWGYADNICSDVCADDDQSNAFDIANAMTADGSAAKLQYIDFVKIQSAINTTAGHLGELSTEVCGVYSHFL